MSCSPTFCVSGAKEDFAPPLSGMPGQFPVYLRLPYRRDYYFCFRNEAKKEAFLSILSDCIRHQNHGEILPQDAGAANTPQQVHLLS